MKTRMALIEQNVHVYIYQYMPHTVIFRVYEMSDNETLSSSKSKLVNNAKYRAH